MPDPKFMKPWHSIPRETITWHPAIIEARCRGCGTCVTGCNRLVYRFDYSRRKPVVFDPLNCMVGCTTCANTCPADAIIFPPREGLLALGRKPEVLRSIHDDLQAHFDYLDRQWLPI